MTEWPAAVRTIHLLGLAVLIGGIAFAFLVARPAYREVAAFDLGRTFERFQLKVSSWAIFILLLTLLFGLFFQVAVISGRSQVNWADVSNVLTGTQYGRVWLLRLSLVLALLFHMLGRNVWKRVEQKMLDWKDLLLAFTLVATLPLSGHPAAGEGTVLFFQVATDALHLFAAALWLGGLLPLALLLHWSRGTSSAVSIVQQATRRFSLLGLACVSLLVVTGFLNAWSLVGGFAPLLGTLYGWLLLAKLALMLPLIGLAAVNLLLLKPKLLALDPHASLREFRPPLRVLERNVMAETGLGVLIFVIVGWLAFTPPARHIQPSWPFSFRWSWATVNLSPKIQSEVFAGTAVAVFGGLSLCAAALWRHKRGWMGGVGLVCLGYGGIVALPALSIDAYPTTYTRPSVPYHAISVANGHRLYQENCALCHGMSGYGDGPVAGDLKPRPADLTAKHAGDHTAGDLFWWLSHGVRDTAMPGYGAALSSEERWDLVNFMRALSAAEQARSMAPLIEARPWLVAPDFSYRASNGEERSLKDHRGEKVILLILFSLPHSRERIESVDHAYLDLRSLGVEVLAIPRDQPSFAWEERTQLGHLPIIIDGGQEVFEVYTLFRRSLSVEGSLPDPPVPPHMEFLIDRQGYMRARWIPGDGAGWSKAEILLGEIERLAKERPRAPAPDEHIH